jgi:hypothetical protein
MSDLSVIVVVNTGSTTTRISGPGLDAKIQKIGRVFVFPGENENQAIAEGVACVLAGTETVLTWPKCIIPPEIYDPLSGRHPQLEKGA